jgi:hypothetical protein
MWWDNVSECCWGQARLCTCANTTAGERVRARATCSVGERAFVFEDLHATSAAVVLCLGPSLFCAAKTKNNVIVCGVYCVRV